MSMHPFRRTPPPPGAALRSRGAALAALCLLPMAIAGCAASQGGASAPCTPAQAASGSGSGPRCLYDPESGTYRECFHVTADGRCAHFGAPCAAVAGVPPADSSGAAPCLYDSTTGTHRVCHHVTAGGGCAHFGAPCTR